MKTNSLQKIKFIVLAIVVGLGVNYATAWVGPTATAPGNNIESILDVSDTDQAKGGAGVVPNILLDIDAANNGNETFSTNSLAVWGDIKVAKSGVGDAYVNSIPGPGKVCADHTGKLVVCP